MLRSTMARSQLGKQNGGPMDYCGGRDLSIMCQLACGW